MRTMSPMANGKTKPLEIQQTSDVDDSADRV